MRAQMTGNRTLFLIVGLIAGLAIAQFWPREPAYAVTTDRDARFALTTCTVSVIGVDPIEAVFVLDFLTGQLKGSVLSRQLGQFVLFYWRDLANDFSIDPKVEPRYAIVNGQGQLLGRQGV